MKKYVIVLVLVAFVIMTLALMPTVKTSFQLEKKLSAYQFFAGKLSDLQPQPGVIPYTINSELFSNYAGKLRFIRLPGGTKAGFTNDGPLALPVGTVIIKNFYYDNDFRFPGRGRRMVETRLLVHEDSGWNPYPYVWNDDQTEAFYDVAGDIKKINYVNAQGKNISIDYVIPNKNQCKGCHIRNGMILPIGPTAAQLNRNYAYSHGEQNQLDHWWRLGMIENLPEISKIEKMPSINDVTQSLDARARAYLDVNCGTCHHPQGPANTSGLFLHFDQDPTVELGIMKSPVAAGRGAGKNAFDIVPGKPHKSILAFRMKTNDPGIAMPELGREQVHKEGVKLVRDWIKQMKD